MTFSLMIHGGAGTIRDPGRYESSLREILLSGMALLAGGASAVDAVEHCVALLEDDPHYNAGRGSVLNADGAVECDASIMDGRDLRAGAAAGLRSVRNPVRLARAVMEKTEHVFLIGEGAERFARDEGLEIVAPNYFVTPSRQEQFARTQSRGVLSLDHSDGQEKKLGTVGAVARDARGDLAAATSTGGLVNKRFGRVGDSPVIGAGTFADNASCAVSCTGVGEDFLRTALARTAAFFVEFLGMSAPTAAEEAIRYLTRKVGGSGGLILIDRDGRCARAHSTPGLLWAGVENGAIMDSP
jgi:beta-aspartyl-peptidase (threonine type)